MIRDLIVRSRSIRRFKEREPIALNTLRDLVDMARLSPTGGNVQPLKFLLSADATTNAGIFPHLAWAGYLKNWPGPSEGERPAAYILILGDTEITSGFGNDTGIAAQSIMLGAAERGLGGCMIGSIKRDALRTALTLPDRYKILLVLALGVPAEKVELEAVGPDGDIKYWRDADGVHHVPKRSLDDLILEL